MDSGTILVSAMSIAICILPFALVVRSKKKRENELLNALNNIAKQHNGSISQFEHCGNFVIGLDDKTNLLFFYTKGDAVQSAQTIHLNEIQSCRVINSTRSINGKNGNYSIIEKLELSFTPTDRKKPETALEFFSTKESDRPSGELQAIEKWSKMVNQIVKK